MIEATSDNVGENILTPCKLGWSEEDEKIGWAP